MEAVRAGGVVLANALGGGVIESPGDGRLSARNVARALLGEELKIPDIATIWCGTEWGRKEALARLRPCHPARRLRCAAAVLAQFQRQAGRGHERRGARARHRPASKRRGETMVLQEISPLGLAPVFENGQFGAKPVSLRVFAAWTPNGWMVMPGGLTRVAADDTVRALSMQSGASSQGCLGAVRTRRWTISACWPAAARAVEIKRHGESAPSRAMDNLFWLGRYAERTESLCAHPARGDGAAERRAGDARWMWRASC